MPNPKGPHTRVVLVEFTPNASIRKVDLDIAIAGGIKKARLDRAGYQLRDEIVSTVYFDLVKYFARGKILNGKLSSLAFQIAYHVSIDTFRRPDKYDKRRAGNIEVCDAKPRVEIDVSVETAETRLLRRARTKAMAGTLTAALSKLSTTDRRTLIEMLKRREPLPRETTIDRKIANAIAQREKRARDRLTEAVRAAKQNGR